MIQLFHGPDTFESYYAAKAMAQKVAGEHNVTLQVVDADEVKVLQDFLQHVEGVGLFAETAVLFVKRLFQNKILVEYFVDHFENMQQFDLILWEDNKVKSNLKLYKAIQKTKKLTLFTEPKRHELSTWIKQQSKKHEVDISTFTLSLLIERTDANKWLIDNELQKLSLVQNFDEIRAEDVIPTQDSYDIWKFVEAFSSRNKAEAYKQLKRILQLADAQYVISMIRRELFTMSLVYQGTHGNDELKALRIHPFAFQKAKTNAKRFSWNELRAMTKSLLNLDYSIKQGNMDGNLGLTLFLQLL